MTPNEKELLSKFQEVPEASAVTMSKMMNPSTDSAMDLSVDYVQRLCQGLVAQGHLEIVEGGRWPVFAVARELSRDKEEILDSNSVKGEEVEDNG